VLEPYAVKVASTVLRRERRGNPPDLSDANPKPLTIETNPMEYNEDQIEMLIRHCKMFLYGNSVNPEIIVNQVAEDFFHFALLHLTSTMFLIKDPDQEQKCGVFHRILDPIGESGLLDEIDKILQSPVGNTNLGEFIRRRRNKLATHSTLSITNLPEINLEVTYNSESLDQFNSAIERLIPEVSKLHDKLKKLIKTKN